MNKIYCLLLLLFATQSNLPFCLANDGGPVLRPPIDTPRAQPAETSEDAGKSDQAALPTDIRPSPNSSLEELYPQSSNKTPYAASSNDPALTDKQKREAEQVPIAPIPVSELLPIGNGKLPPIQLEASFNEPISLKRVLEITLENSLPIRISQAGFDSQRYLFYGALGGFIPSLTTTYRGQKTDNSRTVNTLFSDSTTVTYPVFQGGRVTYNAYANLYRTRAAKQQYFATVNDALLESYRSYYNLLLNQTLLQIRVKSVELSRTQLKLNEQLKAAGVGTNFAIYQSRTQLALDKQALLQQQVLVRTSALALARVLNQSMVINFIPQEKVVRELRLIDANVDIEQITDAALRLRPELKQYENLRMAANRQVQVNASGFYPSMQFFTFTHQIKEHECR
jgi:outer membrane protein TolC